MAEAPIEGYIDNAIDYYLNQKKQHVDIISGQIDSSKVIESFRNFCGWELKGGEWNQIIEYPPINEKGIRIMSWWLKVGIEKGTVLSRFADVNEVNKAMMIYANNVYDIMIENFRAFELDMGLTDAIGESIIFAVERNINRAMEMRTANLLNKNISLVEQQSTINQPKTSKLSKGLI